MKYRAVYILLTIVGIYGIIKLGYAVSNRKKYTDLGIEWNVFRKKLNIPFVEIDWIDSDLRENVWFDSTLEQGHFGKIINFKENYIIREIDSYKIKDSTQFRYIVKYVDYG
jgi:hypothetical protein